MDVFAFDFTWTQGKETHFEDLFEIVEEIKNRHIVDGMYGIPKQEFLSETIVIIFTNQNIKDFRRYLAGDRWEPFIISSHDGSLAYCLPDDHHFIPFDQYLETNQASNDEEVK